MAVTMQDIAKDLKVSVVTVSKVLRNKGKISVATRRRVLQRAKELNYQTNWVARSLVTRRTFTIGLLLPDFTHPFFAEIAKAVAETVRPHGYHVVISYFEEDPALERNEAESLVARQVDGLIIASAQPPAQVDLFESIRSREVPFVLIDRPFSKVKANFVGVDNKAVGLVATNHLIEQGCRQIAHLRGPGTGIAADRQAGYRKALENHGLKFSPRMVVEASFGDASGYEAMTKLIEAKSIPDGVFCYNDPVAMGALRALLDKGVNVPDQVAIVGAGNVHYSDMLSVPLSTVDQETLATGRQAAYLLIEQIESKTPIRAKRLFIAPRLIMRKSSQRSKRGTAMKGKQNGEGESAG